MKRIPGLTRRSPAAPADSFRGQYFCSFSNTWWTEICRSRRDIVKAARSRPPLLVFMERCKPFGWSQCTLTTQHVSKPMQPGFPQLLVELAKGQRCVPLAALDGNGAAAMYGFSEKPPRSKLSSRQRANSFRLFTSRWIEVSYSWFNK